MSSSGIENIVLNREKNQVAGKSPKGNEEGKKSKVTILHYIKLIWGNSRLELTYVSSCSSGILM